RTAPRGPCPLPIWRGADVPGTGWGKPVPAQQPIDSPRPDPGRPYRLGRPAQSATAGATLPFASQPLPSSSRAWLHFDIANRAVRLPEEEPEELRPFLHLYNQNNPELTMKVQKE